MLGTGDGGSSTDGFRRACYAVLSGSVDGCGVQVSIVVGLGRVVFSISGCLELSFARLETNPCL